MLPSLIVHRSQGKTWEEVVKLPKSTYLCDLDAPIYHHSLSIYTYWYVPGGYITDDYGNAFKLLYRHNHQFQSYIAQRA